MGSFADIYLSDDKMELLDRLQKSNGFVLHGTYTRDVADALRDHKFTKYDTQRHGISSSPSGLRLLPEGKSYWGYKKKEKRRLANTATQWWVTTVVAVLAMLLSLFNTVRDIKVERQSSNQQTVQQSSNDRYSNEDSGVTPDKLPPVGG